VTLRLECGGRILESILLSLRVLHHDGHAEQPLAGKAQSQGHGLRILELDVGDAFEALCLVARDQAHVAHLSHAGEELLQITSTHSLRQLDAEDGAGVPLLGTQLGGWGSVASSIRWRATTGRVGSSTTAAIVGKENIN